MPLLRRLKRHHTNPKLKGGSNRVSNGITLCKKCHTDLHEGHWKLDIKPRNFRYPAHTQQGKWYLFNKLKERFTKVKICYGWMTAKARRSLGLEKEHYNDASAMLGANEYVCKIYNIKPRRTKIWGNNPNKTCTEKNGLKHFDIVKAMHRTRGIVIGSIRSLKAKAMTLRTKWNDNFEVSYRKSRLLWRPRGLIYCRIGD